MSARALVRACVAAALAAAAATAVAQPTVAQRLAVCLDCHGAKGVSDKPGIPSLGGQPSFFLITQLFLFREGRRASDVMIAAAKGMTDDDLRSFSDQLAKLPPPPPPPDPPDKARVGRGEAVSSKHRCNVCHGADFAGAPQVPRLANQREDYLLKAMRDFKSGRRLGYGGAMAEVFAGVSEAEIVDLAHYLSHLPQSGGARR